MLSIVIPYYKFSFFEATLESLASQTDKRFHVYIGNDSGPVNPVPLLKKFEGEFHYTYKAFASNLGGTSLVKQWERCIALTGDEPWLMILGDDDVLGAECVSEFYAQLPQFNTRTNVIRFATARIDAAGVINSEKYVHPQIQNAADFLFNKGRSSLSEYIFRKEKVKTIGFRDFPLAWLSDVLAILEFSEFQDIYSINEACVFIRTSEENISGRQDNLKLKYEAVFKFYYYLITKKKQYFTKEQLKLLIISLNKSYLNDKKNIIYFAKITQLHFSQSLWRNYFLFLKSVGKKIIIALKKKLNLSLNNLLS